MMRPLERIKPMRKKYGFGKFLLDAALTFVTGGFWLIYVFVREMRNR